MILTLIIVALFAVVALWNCKGDPGESFMSKDTTTFLKGVAAIVIVFVHIPLGFQNSLQEAVGSFAYVGVTTFFMISSYGMLYSIDRSEKYLKNFWRNRLSSLIIPNIIINIVAFGIMAAVSMNPALDQLYMLNRYVWVLLEFCVVFYVVMLFRHRINNDYVTDGIMIVCVTASSLVSYLYDSSIFGGWCYERMGLVWGILIYRFRNEISKFLTRKVGLQLLIMLVICGALGVAYLKFKSVWFFGEYLLKIVLGLALIYLALILSKGRRFGKPILFIGKISYEIYLYHIGLVIILAHTLPEISSGLFLLLTFAITIILSYLTHLVDQPIVKKLRK